MANLGGFDANQVQPAGDFSPLPKGKYEAVIVESEMIENSSGNGRHLKLTFLVTKGEYEGRNLWSRLNLENPSEKAVQIARGQLSAICRWVGVMTPKDSSELHNLPLMVSVDVDEPTDTGAVYNRITAYGPKNKNGETKKEEPKTAKKAPWTK